MTNPLLSSANWFIFTDDPGHILEAYNELRHVASRYPVQVGAEYEVLNALLALERDNPNAATKMRELIDGKRAAAGKHMLWPSEPVVGFDRNVYQRELMQSIRERARRAAAIENLQRPEGGQLIGNARLEFMRHINNVWGQRRDTAMEAARAHANSNRLPFGKQEQARIRENFWKKIDAEMDEKEAAIRAELLKPAHQRKKI